MRKIFALLSLLIVASMVLAACGGAAPAEEPAAPAEEPAAEEPAAEEPAEEPAAEEPAEEPAMMGSADPTTFNYITFGGPETFDPALAYETAGGEIIQNVYETLIFYDGIHTDKFLPQLAESWEVSDDGLTYTFKIREGVTFHEGQTLDVFDVEYSFERGVLQGSYSSPQWLIAEPFFGVGLDDITCIVDDCASHDDREALLANDAETLLAACERLTSAIVADEAAGTVTMTLAQPWGPFIPTIAQTWGSVLDKDWTIEQGMWDGDCNTWQNYYAEPSESNALTPIMNGTGPFILENHVPGEETTFVRNDNYWREPAQLERMIIKYVDEWGTRFAMAQAGDADFVTVPVANRSQMDALSGELCEFDVAANAYKECVVTDDSQPFRLYKGRPGVSHTDMFFVFEINEVSPYVGSGQLDGNGIPLDFFSDVNIRKAFSYCFDWDVYINDVFDGEAIQTPVIPLAGMPGYQGDMPLYTYDPAKCEEHFKLADVDKDGIPAGEDEDDVWEVGFRLQALYNQGNTTRQTVSEILAGNLADINDNFTVETVGLPWPTFLRTLRNAEGPYFVSGWQEDIHDAHNWYQPYVVGTYAGRQRMEEGLKAQFQELVNAGVAAPTNDERAAIYAELNQLFYDTVPTNLLATGTSHGYERRWVKGRTLNPIFSGDYWYTMYKE